MEPLLAQVAGSRPILALDLPGHGESDPLSGGARVGLSGCVRAVEAALDALDPGVVDIVGLGSGGLVGLGLLAATPGRVGRLLLMDPPALDDEQRNAYRSQGLPSMAADWHGGHLSRCWHMVRDGRLYFPWFRRDQQAIRWTDPDLDDARIHAEVVEYLKAEGAWQTLLLDTLDYPLRDRLAATPGAVTLVAVQGSPWHGPAERLATATGQAFHSLPDATDAQGVALVALLASAGTQR
jgi:pimeloyl-ACP methyl ester carboxylesterase